MIQNKSRAVLLLVLLGFGFQSKQASAMGRSNSEDLSTMGAVVGVTAAVAGAAYLYLNFTSSKVTPVPPARHALEPILDENSVRWVVSWWDWSGGPPQAGQLCQLHSKKFDLKWNPPSLTMSVCEDPMREAKTYFKSLSEEEKNSLVSEVKEWAKHKSNFDQVRLVRIYQSNGEKRKFKGVQSWSANLPPPESPLLKILNGFF